MNTILLILSAIFYSVLSIFSIVTGLIYMSGKKELKPIELSDKFVDKLNKERIDRSIDTIKGFIDCLDNVKMLI